MSAMYGAILVLFKDVLATDSKFYHKERSARYHVEKTGGAHSDGGSDMPVSQLIKLNHYSNMYCYLQFAGACGDQIKCFPEKNQERVRV